MTREGVLRRASLAALVYTLAVTVGLLLHPFGAGRSPRVGEVAYIGAALLGAWCCVVGARRRSGVHRLPWFLLAAAEVWWAIANGIWMTYEWVLHRDVPVPSAFDPAYLIAIAFLGCGVGVLMRRTFRTTSPLRVLLDALLIASSLFYVAWTFLLTDLPTLGWSAERAITWAYPVGDVALASVAVLALSRSTRRGRATWLLLAGGMLVLSGGDSVWAYANLRGGFRSGTPADLTWVVGYLLVGLAALTDARDGRRVTSVVRDRWLALLPYAPTVLVVVTAALTLDDRNDAVRTTAALVSFVLLGIRQVLAVIENQRLAREMEQRVVERTVELAKSEALMRAVGESISDAVIVLRHDMTVRYASEGLARIGGYAQGELAGERLLHLVHPDDVARAMRIGEDVASAEGSSRTIRCRARRADGSYGHVEITMANLLDHPEVNGHILVIRDISEQHALEDRLRHRAEHDDLTGLFNRSALVESIDARIAAGRHPSVVLLDLDRFKALNDSLGHAVGDQLLQAVAARLQHAVRPGDLVARLGGDEFAVVVDGDQTDAYSVATRALRELELPIVLGGRLVRSGASVGVAAHGATSGELLRNADLAMYDAKAQGRNRVEMFREALHARLLRRVRLEEALRGAVSRRELHLVFQPVVALATGSVLGAEALLRWVHEGEAIDPGEFVAIAEESGQIIDIGRWVLNQACAEAATWQSLRPDGPLPTVAVNVSVRQLVDSDLVGDVRQALGASGLQGPCLTIELTESAVMEHSEQVVARLRALRDLGVRISIDDFGTGHSSLGRLERLPVDEIKIDRSFVGSIASAAERPPVVEAIIALAGSLDLHVVAEGIETGDQLACLLRCGCVTGQGYLFGPGLSPSGFQARLRPEEVDNEALNFSV